MRRTRPALAFSKKRSNAAKAQCYVREQTENDGPGSRPVFFPLPERYAMRPQISVT
jgi:hypothetical protein